MEAINHECYVSLEVAKQLKKAGFNWEVHYYYTTDADDLLQCLEMGGRMLPPANCNEFVDGISAPTLDVAQRWLREIRHRSIEVKSFVDGTVENRGKWWIWHMYDFNPPIDWVLLMGSDRRYSTYEEALEAGIKKCLTILLED